MTKTFVESCVDFEVAHLFILMAWRLPYPEIPTLNMPVTFDPEDFEVGKPKQGMELVSEVTE